MPQCCSEVSFLSTSSFPPMNLIYGGWWGCGPFGCSVSCLLYFQLYSKPNPLLSSQLFLLFEHETVHLKRKRLLTTYFWSSRCSMLLFPSFGSHLLLSGLLTLLPSLQCMPGRYGSFHNSNANFWGRFFVLAHISFISLFASFFSLDGWKAQSRDYSWIMKILCLLFLRTILHSASLWNEAYRVRYVGLRQTNVNIALEWYMS